MKRTKKLALRFVILTLMMLMTLSPGVSAAKTALNKTKLTLNVGESYTLKLKNNKKKVTWSSSNYPKVTVSTSGRVVARKKGTVTITAQVGNNKYTCRVTVKQPVTKVTLNQTAKTLTVGKTFTLKATVTPSNANNKKVTWSSSDKTVATVSSSGKVKAVSAGTAVITATAKDGSKKSASCKVTVKAASSSGQSSSGTTSTTTGISENAQKLLNALQTISNRVKSDVSQGRIWIYKTVRHDRTWEAELEDAANGTGNGGNCTCIQMVRWGLKLAGIITVKQDVRCAHKTSSGWVVDGSFTHNSKISDEEFNSKFEIIKVNKTAKQLISEGILKPGDICGYSNHENVYAGDGKWYDAGRGADGSWKNGTYYFNSFGPVSGYMNQTVVEILRLK